MMYGFGRVPLRKVLLTPQTLPRFFARIILPLQHFLILPNATNTQERSRWWAYHSDILAVIFQVVHTGNSFFADSFSFHFQR